MDLNGPKRNCRGFLARNLLDRLAFQSNTDNDVTVSNMLAKGADTSSRSMFSEHNAGAASSLLLLSPDLQGTEGRSGYPGARGDPGFPGFPGVKGTRTLITYFSVCQVQSFTSGITAAFGSWYLLWSQRWEALPWRAGRVSAVSGSVAHSEQFL